jgi:hypothetical protein
MSRAIVNMGCFFFTGGLFRPAKVRVGVLGGILRNVG